MDSLDTHLDIGGRNAIDPRADRIIHGHIHDRFGFPVGRERRPLGEQHVLRVEAARIDAGGEAAAGLIVLRRVRLRVVEQRGRRLVPAGLEKVHLCLI